MALDFVCGGGQFEATSGPITPGFWGTIGSVSVTNSSVPTLIGSDGWAYVFANNQQFLQTPALASNYTSLYAGFRMYIVGSTFGGGLIAFYDFLGNIQCQLNCLSSGLIAFVNHTGAQIGANSTIPLIIDTWTYIEFKAIFSNVGGGTCEVRVNGTVVASSSGLANAQNGNGGNSVRFLGSNNWERDFYVVDGVSGANTNYLGDINAIEVFGDGPGYKSNWLPAVNVGAFLILSVANGGGSSAIYTGVITGGGSNAYVNYCFNTNGFGNANDNQIAALCTSSNTAALVLTVSGTIVPEVNTCSAIATPPFVLSSVNATSNVFTGFVPGGIGGNYIGYNFNVIGFTNASNNVTNASCVASNATSLTLSIAGLVTETHASPVANASFQAITQIGINGTGTRPGGDIAFLYDNNPGDISDFLHTQLQIAGIIYGIAQVNYVRKDSQATRMLQLYCNSSGAIEVSANITAGQTYQYWTAILETDPNTSTQWSLAGFNAATFGVKEIL